MTSSRQDPARRPRLMVRRLPDTKRRLRTRKQYEVGCWAPGADEPLWVKQTEHPGSVLRSEGVHSTDVHDYVVAADRAWGGGVGPWHGFPGTGE